MQRIYIHRHGHSGAARWSALEALLASARATHQARLVGHLNPVGTLLPPDWQFARTDSHIDVEGVARFEPQRLFADVPLAYLCALQFAYHDVFQPIWLDPPDGIEARLLPLGAPQHPLANRNTGWLDLGSVYGLSALEGDVSMQLRRSLNDPWAPAKFQTAQGDLLRLHDTVSGKGAMFRESFFETLPVWLRPEFFRDGDLRLDCAIIPEARNDTSLLLSQFHYAVIAFHNRAVYHLYPPGRMALSPHEVFRKVRTITVQRFQQIMYGAVLERFCDPDCLIWCKNFHKDKSLPQGPAPPQAVIFHAETAACLEALLSYVRPAVIYPQLGSSRSNRQLSHPQVFSPHDRAGLPHELFTSQRIPCRLSPKNHIDWASFLGMSSGPVQSLTTAQQAPDGAANRHALSISHQIARATGLRSGQSAASYVTQSLGLPLDHLTPRDVIQTLHLHTTPQALAQETPLSTYVIAEAELLGQNGRLGPLGSVILALAVIEATREHSMQHTDIGDVQSKAPDDLFADFLNVAGPAGIT